MATPSEPRPRQHTGRPSIYHVANLAGVSHQTVSRVLNHHSNVREATRQRVLQAMHDVGYTPNPVARALASNRTRQIGVIVEEPTYYGPSSTLWGIEAAARQAGYAVSALPVSSLDLSAVKPELQHLRAQGVDALCVVAPRYSRADLGDLDLPTLLVTAEPESGILTASVNQYMGGLLAVDHLLDLGHRRILHLAGPPDWADGRVRARAYADRMAEAGLPVREIVLGDWSADSGYKCGLDPEAISDATAVFVANDQMALGLLHGLHARGIKVPESVSVVGFDDIPEAKHFFPPLTTVRQDFFALGKIAVRALIAQLEGAGAPSSPESIAPKLKVRESTSSIVRTPADS